MPWVKKALEDLGADTPPLFDEGDGIDFEAVAATNPDVILAAYSGLSQQDYDTLSEIAPVVAYPDKPWTTDWRDMIRLNSTAIGMKKEGDALIARIEAKIAEEVAKHPELKGKSGMFVTHLDPTDLSTVNFYSANDARVKFFEDIGMKSPKGVLNVSSEGVYSGSISAERVDTFEDVDIIVTYGSEKLIAAVTSDPLLSRIPAVQRGSIVSLGNDPVGSAASPTPLSISWVLSDYIQLLADAAKKVE